MGLGIYVMFGAIEICGLMMVKVQNNFIVYSICSIEFLISLFSDSVLRVFLFLFIVNLGNYKCVPCRVVNSESYSSLS